MAAKPYNGHESWNAWNVALWIGNDEGLYRMALDYLAGGRAVRDAAKDMLETLREFGHDRTPDGARYSARTIALAMRGLR